MRDNFLFFYIDKETIGLEMKLLSQIVQQYGEPIILGPMIALKPLSGDPQEILSSVIKEFQILWDEYKKIRSKMDW